MKHIKMILSAIAVLLISASLLGCNNPTGAGATGSGDTTAPFTISSVPADAATGVARNSKISIAFSENMDPTSITTIEFTLVQGSTPVAGSVTYEGVTALFTPTSTLGNGLPYTAVISTEAKDLAGNKLTTSSKNTFGFTTGATSDSTPPTVASTVPVDLAVGVPTNSNIIANFIKPMDPTTLTTTTFTLKQGSTAVEGSVVLVGKVATFHPTSDLAPSTLYTARITTGVADLAGNNLAVAKSWSFTTGTGAVTGAVDLGTAGNFVILSKSGITNTGATAVTGNMGVSPIGEAAVTGFAGYSEDGTHLFWTSTQVDGNIYASDNDSPTPTILTTAILDMQNAYTNAAGRKNPSATELGAGDISGMTLSPGLYKWSTDLYISNAGVTLNGGANDVWIFQISGKLTMDPGAIVHISGGAQAKNIFWQAFGLVALDTTAHLEGNVLSQTAITLNTGASVNGKMLAQTDVTLNDNAVVLK